MSVGSAVYQSTIPGFGGQVLKDAVLEPLYPGIDHNPAPSGSPERRGQQAGDVAAIVGGIGASAYFGHRAIANFNTGVDRRVVVGSADARIAAARIQDGSAEFAEADARETASVMQHTRGFEGLGMKEILPAALALGGLAVIAAGAVDLTRSHHHTHGGGTPTPPPTGGGDTTVPPTTTPTDPGDTDPAPPTTTPPDTGGSTPPDDGTTPPTDGSGSLPPTTPPDTNGSTPPDGSADTPPTTGGSGHLPPNTPPNTDGTMPPDGSGTTPPTDGSGDLPPTTPPDTDGSTPPDGSGDTPPTSGGTPPPTGTPPTPGKGDCGPMGTIPTPPDAGGSTPPTPGKGDVTQTPPPVTGSGNGGTPPKTGNIYTVQHGDYLTHIAQSTHRTWEQIYTANRGQISNPDLIYPGERLVIPAQDAPNPPVTYQHLYPGGVVNPKLHDETLTTS